MGSFSDTFSRTQARGSTSAILWKRDLCTQLIEFTNYTAKMIAFTAVSGVCGPLQSTYKKKIFTACCKADAMPAFHLSYRWRRPLPTRLCDIVSSIKSSYQLRHHTFRWWKIFESYQALFEAGCRPLSFAPWDVLTPMHCKNCIRHSLTAENRQQCLWHLKIGYQVNFRIYGRFPLSNFWKSCRRWLYLLKA